MISDQVSWPKRWEEKKAFLARMKIEREARVSIEGKRKRREAAANAEAETIQNAVARAEARYPAPSSEHLEALRARETRDALSRLCARFRAGTDTTTRADLQRYLTNAIRRRQHEPSEPTVSIERMLRDALLSCLAVEGHRATSRFVPNWLDAKVVRKTLWFATPIGPIPSYPQSDGSYSLERDESDWWKAPRPAHPGHVAAVNTRRVAAPNPYAYEIPIDPLFEAQCALDGIGITTDKELGAPSRQGSSLIGERCFGYDPASALLLACGPLQLSQQEDSVQQ